MGIHITWAGMGKIIDAFFLSPICGHSFCQIRIRIRSGKSGDIDFDFFLFQGGIINFLQL